jgi:AcrR family transcriptional regulator
VRGYHQARVGDIAEEAGVAHGLLYHYFTRRKTCSRRSSDDTWSELLARCGTSRSRATCARAAPAASPRSCSARGARQPDLVRVLVLEVTRSAQLASA